MAVGLTKALEDALADLVVEGVANSDRLVIMRLLCQALFQFVVLGMAAVQTDVGLPLGCISISLRLLHLSILGHSKLNLISLL